MNGDIIRIDCRGNIHRESKDESMIQIHGENLVHASASFRTHQDFDVKKMSDIDVSKTKSVNYIVEIGDTVFDLQVKKEKEDKLREILGLDEEV